MKYDSILCMMVDDTVKTRDAGGFAPGSKAKITVENEGTQYETYAVEYGGRPLKRGFKTREAAKNYAKSQGLTTDSAIDEVIKACDFPNEDNSLSDIVKNAKEMLLKELKSSDAGRGYDQLKREAKGLLGIAKEVTTKINRLNDNCKTLRESVRSDGSMSSDQRKEIERLIDDAFNYIGNHTEV